MSNELLTRSLFSIAGIAIAIGLVTIGFALWIAKSPGQEFGKAVSASPFSSTPKDASSQASRLAAGLDKSPRCDRFRVALATAGKGSATEGRTQVNIQRALRDAQASGC